MRKYILFLIAASGSFIAQAQNDSISEALDIGNNAEYEGFEILDSALLHNQLFLSGEDYNYTSFNSKVEFKLLRYMNHRVGLRNYVLETSPAKANLINQYISQSDSTVETLLQSVSKVKYMRLYKNLKRLNKKLPDSLQIRVHGIDVERSNALPLVKMSQYLRTDSVPDDLRIVVEAITGAAKYIISRGLEEYEKERNGGNTGDDGYFYNPTAFSVRMSVDEFMKVYDSLHSRFESWLGPNYAEFNNAVDWLKEYKTWYQFRRTAFEFSWREEVMYQRLNELIKLHPDEKFFGQLGLCRTCNQRVPEGCGTYNFSGVVNKLRNYPESLGKNLVNIGIYYAAELDKIGSDGDEQHMQYEKALKELMEKAPDNAAVLIDLDKFSSPELRKEYQFVLLNNDYKLFEDDMEETDSAVYDDSYLKDYRNASVYIGFVSFNPMVDLKNTNAELAAANLPEITNISTVGGEIAFALNDRAMGRFYGGASTADSGNYKGMAIFFEGGQALVHTKYLKMGILSHTGYVRHTVTEFSSSNASTYLVNFQAPKVYKNPAFIVGIGANVFVDIAPFYIVVGGGRQWDLGRKAWKLDGSTTGSKGGISNTAWYFNYGFGISLPLRWID